jgi:hypothetical protein
MDEVVLTGAGLGAGCHVDFLDAPPHQAPSKTFPAKVVVVNPTTLKAAVPVGVPLGLRALRVIWNGKAVKEWPFTVLASVPVIPPPTTNPPYNPLNPSMPVFPGDTVTITAKNLRPAPPGDWKVSIDVAPSVPGGMINATASPRSVNADQNTHEGTVVFEVPDVYVVHEAVPVSSTRPAQTLQDAALQRIAAPKTVSILRAGTRSNAVTIKVNSPHYILTSVSPGTANQGDVVTVTGTNYWAPSGGARYVGYFDLGQKGRVAAASTEFTSPTTVKLTVPWDIFNGFSQAPASVVIVRDPGGFQSNPLPINLVYKSSTPPPSQCPSNVAQPNCTRNVQIDTAHPFVACSNGMYYCCASNNSPEDNNVPNAICGTGKHPFAGSCPPTDGADGRATMDQGGCR